MGTITIDVDTMRAIAKGMYTGEECRICGRVITDDEVGDALFAGYSIRFAPARAMHVRCWEGVLDIAPELATYLANGGE